MIDDSTIKTAKEFIIHQLQKEGKAVCPCCGSTLGRYKRRISKGQVLFLIELHTQYKLTGTIWHFYQPIKDAVFNKHGNNVSDYTKLSDFGLIVSKGDIKESTGISSGYWSITKKGVAFLKGDIYLPKYLFQTTEGYTFKESDDLVHITNFFPNFKLSDIKY